MLGAEIAGQGLWKVDTPVRTPKGYVYLTPPYIGEGYTRVNGCAHFANGILYEKSSTEIITG
jgi:hypothetical protein